MVAGVLEDGEGGEEEIGLRLIDGYHFKALNLQ